MANYAGGTQVKKGYYIDSKSFAFANVEKDGDTLPGSFQTRWVRLPVIVVMAAAPALGGLFVVTLPFLGFAVAAYAVAKKLGIGAKAGAEQLAATITPGWVPGEAHLTGKPGEKGAPEKEPAAAPAADAKTEALAEEIAAKRAEK